MKTIVLWNIICLALLLFPVGCGKSGTPAEQLLPMQIEGVNVDMPKLKAAFATTTPELQTKMDEVQIKLRYQRYMEAMMALDEVLNSPGVDEKQKKLLSQVIDQLKEVATKAPGKP